MFCGWTNYFFGSSVTTEPSTSENAAQTQGQTSELKQESVESRLQPQLCDTTSQGVHEHCRLKTTSPDDEDEWVLVDKSS